MTYFSAGILRMIRFPEYKNLKVPFESMKQTIIAHILSELTAIEYNHKFLIFNQCHDIVADALKNFYKISLIQKKLRENSWIKLSMTYFSDGILRMIRFPEYSVKSISATTYLPRVI